MSFYSAILVLDSTFCKMRTLEVCVHVYLVCVCVCLCFKPEELTRLTTCFTGRNKITELLGSLNGACELNWQ